MRADTIADWFLAHNAAVVRFNGAEEISNLKLQKLLYYAQGCMLLHSGKPLFEDPIVAWPHGPVVRDVYRRYQYYGSRGISAIPEYPKLSADTIAVLVSVYNHFARFSAWALANLTHKETPWLTAKPNEVIPTATIEEYFANHYTDVVEGSDLTENIHDICSYADYQYNWDGEGGLPFGLTFLYEVIDLVSTLPTQPDVAATGRGSIDLEFGSVMPGNDYHNVEIFEADRSVHVFGRMKDGTTYNELLRMEDVNSYVQKI